ncbi:MAG TPA: hydrogenobyrinic acid a,c-diamide synthase (glutamine-hydrolyzing) [candidate division Zixibacteria bacterium]|nr:hydrogenobyrinic acid a,c-diamide synthase (glutamine-hydrolyzing) [candidate division Zixibacteria bacterium]
MGATVPRLLIAGLSGDSGKTLSSLSVITALRRQGRSVAPFKKGPDFIDAAWLGEVAQNVCRNLDTFMVESAEVLSRFTRHALGAEVAVVEGNRGLFDGMDDEGTHSSASLARLLGTPVILTVDTTKTTRTVAAMIKGCQQFEPDLNIAGVILNRVAGPRHEAVVRKAVETYCGIPVVGVFPKLGEAAEVIPGRHLGLVTPAEFGNRDRLHDILADLADKYLDLDRIWRIAQSAPELKESLTRTIDKKTEKVTIGYFADSVFTFYYPENLEALVEHGARLLPLSSLETSELPDEIDALYIGGGFPETQAERLTANRSLMKSVKNAAADGLPIYAECGGLIYLCRNLTVGDATYAMAGVFDLDLTLSRRPVGHGYVQMEVTDENPFLPRGLSFRGHEFHYSGPKDSLQQSTALKVIRGVGLNRAVDGLRVDNVLACYTHLHADGVPEWADGMVKAAVDYRSARGTEKKASSDLRENNKHRRERGDAKMVTEVGLAGA